MIVWKSTFLKTKKLYLWVKYLVCSCLGQHFVAIVMLVNWYNPVSARSSKVVGVNCSNRKKLIVTETHTSNQSIHILGDDGASSPGESMMPSSSSRKENVRHPPASQIGSRNARSMYQTGTQAQITREMQRNNLDMLGISETYWFQSGQQHMFSGE